MGWNWATCWSIGESKSRKMSIWQFRMELSNLREFRFRVRHSRDRLHSAIGSCCGQSRFGFSHANKVQGNTCWCGQHDIVIGWVFISISIIQIRLAIRTWSSTLCIRRQFVNKMQPNGSWTVWKWQTMIMVACGISVFSLCSLFTMKYAT